MNAKIPFLWYFTKEINFNLNQFNISSTTLVLIHDDLLNAVDLHRQKRYQRIVSEIQH